MPELWQLFDTQGNPLAGQGGGKDDVFGKGLLHGAAHVWIWRQGPGGVEVLLQKRAPGKRTWPNKYDISAAGHIDLGESPEEAAIREAEEEIGLRIHPEQLNFIGIQRMHVQTDGGDTENEFQWLYLLELPDETDFMLQTSEVASMEWKPLADFDKEVHQPSHNYVPHGDEYFDTLVAELQKATA